MSQIECLSHDEAWKLAEYARKTLSSDGRNGNLCVVNRQGQVLIHAAMDETCPATMNIALLKAKEAAYVGYRTRWIRDKLIAGEVTLGLFGVEPEKHVPWAGGVPIYSIEGVLLGAFGISNLTEDEDEHYCIRVIEDNGYLSDRPE